MSVINATPHRLNFHLSDGTKVALDPSGLEPEVQFKKVEVGKVSLYQFLVPVNGTEVDEVIDAPPGDDGNIYIVSRVVASTLKDHQDNLLVPDELIRDDGGRVVGCKSLSI